MWSGSDSDSSECSSGSCSQDEHIQQLSGGQARCTLCAVLLPDTRHNIRQHLAGQQHRDKLLPWLMARHGVCHDSDARAAYCKPCKQHFAYTTAAIWGHVREPEHTNWISSMQDLVDTEEISLDRYLASEKKIYYVDCGMCKCRVSCSYNCVKEHIEGYAHMQARVKKFMPLNGLFDCDDDEKVWCKPCDVYIDNIFADIINHFDKDDDHIDWMCEIEKLIENENISLDKYLIELNESKAFCSSCKVHVPCCAPNLEQHINGNMHRKKN